MVSPTPFQMTMVSLATMEKFEITIFVFVLKRRDSVRCLSSPPRLFLGRRNKPTILEEWTGIYVIDFQAQYLASWVVVSFLPPLSCCWGHFFFVFFMFSTFLLLFCCGPSYFSGFCDYLVGNTQAHTMHLLSVQFLLGLFIGFVYAYVGFGLVQLFNSISNR